MIVPRQTPKKSKLRRSEGQTMRHGEKAFWFYPALGSGWKLEGWPGRLVHRAGGELRRSPGLAGEFGPGLRACARPSRGVARTSRAFRRSDLRSFDSAVQSRVGDGFLVVSHSIQVEGRTSATRLGCPSSRARSSRWL